MLIDGLLSPNTLTLALQAIHTADASVICASRCLEQARDRLVRWDAQLFDVELAGKPSGLIYDRSRRAQAGIHAATRDLRGARARLYAANRNYAQLCGMYPVLGTRIFNATALRPAGEAMRLRRALA